MPRPLAGSEPRAAEDPRTDPGAYPLQVAVVSRVADLDGNGHLNGVRICEYYENARAVLHTTMAFSGVRSYVAQFTVRYLGEAFWPGDLLVGTGVLRIGNSSFVLGQALFQAGCCVGLSETVLVHVAEGRPHPLPDAYRRALDPYLVKGAAAPST